jgi:ATP-dependent DNA helicase RecQ
MVIEHFLKSRGNLMIGGGEFEKGLNDTISNIPDTYELYQEGKSVQEMAKILGIVPGTVVDRLIRDHEKGKNIDLSQLFESSLEEEIHDTVERIGVSKLKPIKDDMESRGMMVSYIDIKLVFYKYYGIRKK